MRTPTPLLLVVLIPYTLCADAPVEPKPLDASFLRQYAETRGYMLGRPVAIKPTPDGKHVLFLRSTATNPKRSLFEFDVATGKTRELLTPEALLNGAEENVSPEEKARRERMRLTASGFADFHLNDKGTTILLPLSGRLFLYERSTGKISELKIPSGSLIDPKWSPDGRHVSYVRGQDLFVVMLSLDVEVAVTAGGSAVKTHGLAEFVAQEEMGRFSGYWWSSDSKSIVYEEVDHTGVETWYVADPTKPDQKPQPQYYPRPGKKNVSVKLRIVPVGGPGMPVEIEWDRSKYEYLAAVRWDKHGPLTIQVQDRKQQEICLLRVDPKTGKTTKLLEEKDVAFTNLRQDMPRWLPDQKHFIWMSEENGAPELQRRVADGMLSEMRILTREGFQSLVHIAPERGEIAFMASEDPTQAHVYYGPYSPEFKNWKHPFLAAKRIAAGPAVETVVFSENKGTFVLTRTLSGQMPKSVVYTREKIVGTLPSVAIEPPFTPKVTFEKLGDDAGLYTAILRPHGFDPAKKYPVIVDVYGGPHHLHVVQANRNWLLPQWLADQGFIVVAIDNRGTPGRGRDWERTIYQAFGTVPLEDQVKGLKLLGAKYPEMDLDRVGITGWSFGGYMSALAVLKRPDIYKAAVAGAPVTDWEDYDTHYTERYLGLLPESKKAYEDASLLPLAAKLERPLLLVHGTADDNVYFRHTLRLTDALFRAGKDFEVLPLPGLTHMVPDPVVTERLWTRVAGHFQKHLGKPRRAAN